MTQPPTVSFAKRMIDLAHEHPKRKALILVTEEGGEQSVSWRELDRASNRMARFLATRGGELAKTMIVLGIPNCLEHFVVAIAAWKLGACVLPLNPGMAAREKERLITIAKPALIVADWTPSDGLTINRNDLCEANKFSDSSVPDRIAAPGKAIASGGSTGQPKIIVDPSPLAKYP